MRHNIIVVSGKCAAQVKRDFAGDDAQQRPSCDQPHQTSRRPATQILSGAPEVVGSHIVT